MKYSVIKIENLQELTNPQPNDFFVIKNTITGEDMKIRFVNVAGNGQATSLVWDPDKVGGYATDEIAEYNGKIWKSLVDANAAQPAEGANWTEVSQATGSRYLANAVYNQQDHFVVKDNAWYQLSDTAVRPFQSTDFEAELTAGYWIPIVPRDYFNGLVIDGNTRTYFTDYSDAIQALNDAVSATPELIVLQDWTFQLAASKQLTHDAIIRLNGHKLENTADGPGLTIRTINCSLDIYGPGTVSRRGYVTNPTGVNLACVGIFGAGVYRTFGSVDIVADDYHQCLFMVNEGGGVHNGNLIMYGDGGGNGGSQFSSVIAFGTIVQAEYTINGNIYAFGQFPMITRYVGGGSKLTINGSVYWPNATSGQIEANNESIIEINGDVIAPLHTSTNPTNGTLDGAPIFSMNKSGGGAGTSQIILRGKCIIGTDGGDVIINYEASTIGANFITLQENWTNGDPTIQVNDPVIFSYLTPIPGGSGEANTLVSQGTGASIFKQKTGVNLEVRSILAGEGTAVEQITDEIRLNGVRFDRDSRNYYWNTDADSSSLGASGSFLSPFGWAPDLVSAINADTVAGDVVTIWLMGSSDSGFWKAIGYGQIGRATLPGGRIYRFKPYNRYKRALLNGLYRVDYFVDQGGDIWRANMADLSFDMRAVLVDDQLAPMSTEPTTYEITSWDNANKYLNSNELVGVGADDDRIGCKFDFKTAPWNPKQGNCLDNGASGFVKLDAVKMPEDHQFNVNVTFDMQFRNRLDWCLNENNYFIDEANNYLYIRSATNPNTTKTVQVISHDYGIQIGDNTTGEDIQVFLEEVDFVGYALDGVYYSGKIHDCTIRNADFYHCVRNAITWRGNATSSLNNANNWIYDCKSDKLGAGFFLGHRLFNTRLLRIKWDVYDTDEHIGFQQVVEQSMNFLGDGINFNTFTGNEQAGNWVSGVFSTRSHVNGVRFGGWDNTLSKAMITGWGRNGNDIGGCYAGDDYTKRTTIADSRISGGGYSNALMNTTGSYSYCTYIDNRASYAWLKRNTLYGAKSCAYINIAAHGTRLEENNFSDADYMVQVHHVFNAVVEPINNLVARNNRFMTADVRQKYWYYNENFDKVANPYEASQIDENTYQGLISGAQFVYRKLGGISVREEEGFSRGVWETYGGYDFDKNSVENYYDVQEYEGTQDAVVADNFSGPSVIATSDAVGNFDADIINVTLSANNVIADGQSLVVRWECESDKLGGIIEARVYANPTYVKSSVFFTCNPANVLNPEANKYSICYKNESGANVTVTNIFFRVKGVDGTAVNYTFDNFSAKRDNAPVKVDVELVETADDQEYAIKEGLFKDVNGRTIALVGVEPNKPALIINNGDSPVLDKTDTLVSIL